MGELVDELVHEKLESANVELFKLLNAIFCCVTEYLCGVYVLVHRLLDFHDGLAQLVVLS